MYQEFTNDTGIIKPLTTVDLTPENQVELMKQKREWAQRVDHSNGAIAKELPFKELGRWFLDQIFNN